MKKKFLVIDHQRNTVLLTGEEFMDLLAYTDPNDTWYGKIEQHKTKGEVYNIVKEYLSND